MSTDREPLLTKEELARHLKLPNIESVERLMRKRQIPFLKLSYRVTRFQLSKVEEALEQMEVKTAARTN